jgi:hypothetical protein
MNPFLFDNPLRRRRLEKMLKPAEPDDMNQLMNNHIEGKGKEFEPGRFFKG